MRKLKVAVILGHHIPSYWAHSFNVMKMAQGFAQIGCQVEVITADSEETQRFRKKISNLTAHYGLNKPITVKYISPSKQAYRSGKTNQDPVFCRRVLNYVKSRKFDLTYTRGNFLIPYLLVKAGIPAYLETHSKSSFLRHSNWKTKYKKIMRLSKFKGLITIHKDLKKENNKRGMPAKKILVLEDGVDLHRFDIIDDKSLWKRRLGLNPDYRYAVYCGHLYPEKGIEIILQAAKKMASQTNLIFLLVGGLEKDRKKWMTYCRKNNLTNVKFAGFVDNRKVPLYLKAADCLLLPYKIKNMKYKIMDINTTSPLKLFEYMASNRPIIATSIPTIRKVLMHQSNALLVKPDDIGAFCKAILNALYNEPLSAAISTQAFNDVHQYTWDVRCKTILKHSL